MNKYILHLLIAFFALFHSPVVVPEGDEYHIDKIIIQRDQGVVGDRNTDTWNNRDEVQTPNYQNYPDQTIPNYNRGYSAQAHCGITGVTGFSYGFRTPAMALNGAIQDCILRGGVPHCCQSGAQLIPY
ncbi:MAG: hypothetical protein PHI13_15375 [Methylococcales bacterium]|nr:hypothetical protein [Methylococcales bacterium]